MLLLLTEPPDLEEKEEKEDVEDNPAVKDLNARLASCWHPFDMFVLLHRDERILSFFSREWQNLCQVFLKKQKSEKEKKRLHCI